MKLLEVKTSTNDYVVTVRNGERLLNGAAPPKRLDDERQAEENDFELLESLGLVTKIPWLDPTPD